MRKQKQRDKDSLPFSEADLQKRPDWVLAQRMARARARFRGVGEPEEGAYWWIPRRAGKRPPGWHLSVFYAGDYSNIPGGTAHTARWPEVLYQLAQSWGDFVYALQERYDGLPRGRVTYHPDGGVVILHGNNHPEGTNLSRIAKAFRVDMTGLNRFEYEEHYDLNWESALTISTFLGVRIKVRKRD